MSRSVRLVVFLVGAGGMAVLLWWGLAGLPPFGRYQGPYGDVLNRVAVRERHVTEVVTAVVWDYRGMDTMGEEFILFASAAGVALILRAGRREVEEEPTARSEARMLPAPTDAVRILGLGLIGPTVVLGLYIVAHGHLTPGGGFQGGAILATASLLVFLSGRLVAFRRVNPVAMIDAAEGAGAFAIPLLGVAGLVAGSTFLANFLPLGTTGQLLSGGTIPLLNLAVGLEVAAALLLIVSEFLEQTLLVRSAG
jgi:multicomponent Na+:H+ antiporter subunit B